VYGLLYRPPSRSVGPIFDFLAVPERETISPQVAPHVLVEPRRPPHRQGGSTPPSKCPSTPALPLTPASTPAGENARRRFSNGDLNSRESYTYHVAYASASTQGKGGSKKWRFQPR
jgi:hypothetical protein